MNEDVSNLDLWCQGGCKLYVTGAIWLFSSNGILQDSPTNPGLGERVLARCVFLPTCNSCSSVQKQWCCMGQGVRHPCFFANRSDLSRHCVKYHLNDQHFEPDEEDLATDHQMTEYQPPEDDIVSLSGSIDDAKLEQLATMINSSVEAQEERLVPFNFLKENSSAHLFYELLKVHNYDYSLAAKHVICFCSFRQTRFQDLLPTITNQSFHLFLDVSSLAFDLSESSRKSLSSMLSFLMIFHNDHMEREGTGDCHLFIPSTTDEMKSYITSATNSYSMRNLLPRPSLEPLDNGIHSYCNFVQIIIYIAACSTLGDLDAVQQRYKTLVDSPKYNIFKEELEEEENVLNVIVLIILWGDGFDPNRSKNNRGSAWALTGTYFFCECATDTLYMIRTEPIAIGPDKGSHSSTFRKMAEDLKSTVSSNGQRHLPLVCPSKHHGKGKTVHFYPLLLGSLFDNPERRGNYGLRMGNSLNHTMFGLACHFGRLVLPFEACENCRIIIRTYVKLALWDIPCLPSCPDCHSFSIKRLLENGSYNKEMAPIFEPPEIEGVDNRNIPGILLASQPGRLDCDLLTKGWAYATEMFKTDKWTVKLTRSYLCDVLCINTTETDRLISDIGDQILIKVIKEQGDNNEVPADKFFELTQSLDSNPDFGATLGRHPGMWDLLDVPYAFETIMHNSMNTGKAIADFMFKWAIANRKGSELTRKARPLFQKAEQVRSSDYKVLPFKNKKFGNYVGENWKAFYNICPWALHFLDSQTMHAEKIDPPPATKKISQYTRPELKSWLLFREIVFDNNSRKPVLYDLVLENKNKNIPVRDSL